MSVATGQDVLAIGWDDAGQILMKDGASIRAIGATPYTIPFPADFVSDAKKLAVIGSSPDGTVQVLVAREDFARALFITGKQLHTTNT